MNKKGFTLLEVMLFLAVATVLTVIAIVGLAPRLRNVRFTSAVRDFQSNLAKNLSSNEGVNNRGSITSCSASGTGVAVTIGSAPTTTAGSAGNCIANGVIAIIDDGSNKVVYRQIVSLKNPNGTCNQTDEALKIIRCHNATVLDETAAPQNQVYNYINGLTQQTPEFHTPGVNRKIGFGYVQDPDSTTRYPFIATPKLLFFGSLQSSLNTYVSKDDSFSVCYVLSGRQAKFTFKNTSLTPEVVMNQGCGS